MRKQRKHYTAEEKVAVLRRHLIDNEPVSKLCDQLVLQPTVFYRWQKEFFENRRRRFPDQEPQQSPTRAGTHRAAGEENPNQGRSSRRADGRAHRVKKKALGNSNRNLDRARCPRPDRRFRSALVAQDRDRGRVFYPVARHLARQILLLAETLRLGQRTQRLGPARSLARTLGETSHRRLSPEASVGRIPPLELHDVGRRHRGRQPLERVASSASSGPAAPMEWQAVEERHGFPTAAGTASTLAYRRFLPQCLQHVLLPMQRAGRLQPCDRAVGLARGDEGSRCRDHSRGRQGEISAGPNRGSSPTTGRSLSPRTSRNSFASRA